MNMKPSIDQTMHTNPTLTILQCLSPRCLSVLRLLQCACRWSDQGVSYGHGCYFATTSKYSDLFSRGDKDGWKLIIKAKIVVGRYTVGDSSMKTAPYELRRIIRHILKDVAGHQIGSLLLPLIGAGNVGYDTTTVTKAILDEVVNFILTHQISSALDIQIVILPAHSEKMQIVQDCFEKIISRTNETSDKVQEAHSAQGLRVFYREPSAFDNLITRLDQLRKEKVKIVTWSDQYHHSQRMLPRLSISELATLEETAKGHHVKLSFSKSDGNACDCSLYGLEGDVQVMEKTILQKLQTIKEDKFPPAWTPPFEDYSEPIVPNQTQEHQDVVQALNASLGRTAVINWIKRIQNPHQYEQFTAEQKKVARKLKKSPEEVSKSDVWHGSQAEAIEKICRNNFNRSFAGVENGVAYGHGCYFATASSYSDGYSRPGVTGWKLIIKAKIVIGQSTVGNSSMKTAPYIGQTHEHYNTTVNNMVAPSKYVTYSDPAAYPEYVICYK